MKFVTSASDQNQDLDKFDSLKSNKLGNFDLKIFNPKKFKKLATLSRSFILVSKMKLWEFTHPGNVN